MKPLGLTYQILLWRGVAALYRGIVFSLARSSTGASGIDWIAFQNLLARYLSWVDLTAASSLRYRAIHQRTILPPAEHDQTPDLLDTARTNDWYAGHRIASDPLIEAHAAWVRQTEEAYLRGKGNAIRQLLKNPETRAEFDPIHRLERRRREAYGLISNDSEQIQLTDPLIGEAFPMAMYVTRDDRRVRPTHAAMHRFIAMRSWSGWPLAVAPCGWNCRCYVRYLARFECIREGWMTADGRPKFELRWPNSISEENWTKGRFPEWKTPRLWTFPKQNQQRVA